MRGEEAWMAHSRSHDIGSWPLDDALENIPFTFIFLTSEITELLFAIL
jgi:hypothetical protein